MFKNKVTCFFRGKLAQKQFLCAIQLSFPSHDQVQYEETERGVSLKGERGLRGNGPKQKISSELDCFPLRRSFKTAYLLFHTHIKRSLLISAVTPTLSELNQLPVPSCFFSAQQRCSVLLNYSAVCDATTNKRQKRTIGIPWWTVFCARLSSGSDLRGNVQLHL